MFKLAVNYGRYRTGDILEAKEIGPDWIKIRSGLIIPLCYCDFINN